MLFVVVEEKNQCKTAKDMETVDRKQQGKKTRGLEGNLIPYLLPVICGRSGPPRFPILQSTASDQLWVWGLTTSSHSLIDTRSASCSRGRVVRAVLYTKPVHEQVQATFILTNRFASKIYLFVDFL